MLMICLTQFGAQKMSNIVYFPGKNPVNLDYIMYFDVRDWDIRFIPVRQEHGIMIWSFESHNDAQRVYKELLMQQCSRILPEHMDGNYED